MDRVTCMLSFVKVAENGGFSAAARRLNVSTSIVTGHIKLLEDRLGVRLLNRSTRKVSLTEVGHAYYERCVQILSQMDDADRIAEALQTKPRGTLRLNLAAPMPKIIAPAIAEYVSLYPEMSVDVTVTSHMVKLVEEAFDLAIRVVPIPDSSLIVRHLATYRFVVCGSPGYFESHAAPAQPADLVRHNCMSFVDSPWNKEWRFSGPNGDEVVPQTGNFQANSGECLRMAAIHGQGLIYVPIFVVAEELRSGRLVQTLKNYVPLEMKVDAIYPHREHLSAKVRSFIDLAASHLRNANWTDPLGAH